jgi:hypothetical protein
MSILTLAILALVCFCSASVDKAAKRLIDFGPGQSPQWMSQEQACSGGSFLCDFLGKRSHGETSTQLYGHH